jgi:hypothetical protein
LGPASMPITYLVLPFFQLSLFWSPSGGDLIKTFPEILQRPGQISPLGLLRYLPLGFSRLPTTVQYIAPYSQKTIS